MYRLPGPITMRSASSRARTAPGWAAESRGSIHTSCGGTPSSGSFDSPRTILPPGKRAASVTSSSVEGTIWPRTASTREVSEIAASMLPVTSAMAVMNRLPKEWPAMPSPARSSP